MCWDQVISLIASIGTCVAVILVYFTLREMKEQRQTSIIPEIVFYKKKLYLYTDANETYFWSDCVIKSKSETIDKLLKIETINIGAGAAKNIKITWEYNVDELIEMLESIDENNRSYDFNDDLAIIKISDKTYTTYLEVGCKENFDYIYASNVEKDKIYINVPSSFLHLYGQLIYYTYNKYSCEENKIDDLYLYQPIVNTNIVYEDIKGKKYEKNYKFRFKLGDLGWNNKDSFSQLCTCYLERL